jgi:CheY-like chemotaxis protein
MTETSEQTPSKLKVIVADDEETIATTLAIILNQAGFEARAVFSGEQVVELLDSFQPEVLIIDVVMTGMTGIEVAIAVRNRLPDCRILLFSGQAATADLLEQAKTKILTIAEHDAEKTACPHCGSHEVEQRWSAFSAVTSKKSV